MSKRAVALSLTAAALLALGLRALAAPSVFIGDEVLLSMWDGSYHARRALYSFVRFPEILFFDPYLRFPDGAPVPMPPLYDWLLAAVARLFGDAVSIFERVAAWVSPVVSTLTLLPVYALGALAAGRRVGVTAAALFACLPASVLSSSVGDPDHHAAVAFLGATHLALSAGLLTTGSNRRRLIGLGLALTLTRCAIVLTWSGSLLYVALGEGALLLGGIVSGRVSHFAAQALGALAAAALIAPWVAAGGTPIGGPLSTTTLSWFHCVAFIAVAGVAAGLALLERARPADGIRSRALRLIALGAAIGGTLLLSSTLREALAPGLAFASKADTWAAGNVEQAPLFPWLSDASTARSRTSIRWRGISYVVPLIPLVLLWRARARRHRIALLVFACWAIVLAGLTVTQVRFGSDFAPLASLGLALLLDTLRRSLSLRFAPRVARTLELACAGLLLLPAVANVYLPRLEPAASFLLGTSSRRDPAFARAPTTLVRFAQLVRRSTPDTAGYFDSKVKPEYSVLVKPSHGHVMHYAARRPTPINGFGPYLDAEKDAVVRSFFGAHVEARAFEICQGLGVRYVVTYDHVGLRKRQFAHFLHRLDGSRGAGFDHAERFRLVAESPRGALPLFTAYPHGPPAPVIPYKLFERVAGAVLELRAEPGAPVYASLPIRTNTGRQFVYRAATYADAEGLARLHVPYSTDPEAVSSATGAYRIKVGSRTVEAHVGEDDILRGTSLRVSVD